MIAVVPEMTDEQRRQALDRAMEVRAQRSELRHELKAGRLTLQELFDMDSQAATRMRALDAVKSMPGWGDAKARKLLRRLHVSEARRVGGLGENQRRDLLREIEGGDET